MYKNLEEISEVIHSPYYKPGDLNEKQQEYFDKLDVADNLMRNELSFQRAKEKFVAKFGCTHVTAAKYLREAQALFSSKSRYSKEYFKDVLLEKALAKLDWCYKENRIADFNKTLKNIIVLFGFDRSDSSIIDIDMLQQHNYNIILNLKGDRTTYNLNFNELQQMTLAERQRIAGIIDAEAIDFEMNDIINDDAAG